MMFEEKTKNMNDISVKIIEHSRGARKLASLLLKDAKNGNIEIARKKLENLRMNLLDICKIQTKVIVKEFSGDEDKITLIDAYAQSYFLSTLTYYDTIENTLDLWEKFYSDKKTY